jgi:hypothetical protein
LIGFVDVAAAHGNCTSKKQLRLNGSIARSGMTARELELLSFGTTRNEALHYELKSVQTTILQEHAERAMCRFDAFSLAKLLSHNAAAYHPNVAQRKQCELLATILGHMTRCFFSSFGNALVSAVTSKEAMRAPVHNWDVQKAQVRKAVSQAQAVRWEQQLLIKQQRDQKRKVLGPEVAKGPLKRTVFTKRKQQRLRRTAADEAADSAGAGEAAD